MEFNDSLNIVQISEDEFIITENGIIWDHCITPFTTRRQAYTVILRERLIRVLKEKRSQLHFS